MPPRGAGLNLTEVEKALSGTSMPPRGAGLNPTEVIIKEFDQWGFNAAARCRPRSDQKLKQFDQRSVGKFSLRVTQRACVRQSLPVHDVSIVHSIEQGLKLRSVLGRVVAQQEPS